MVVAVIGAGGTLGRSLMEAAEGPDVWGVSHGPDMDLGADPPVLPDPPVGTTHAVVCSSLTAIDACFRDPAGTARFNVDNTVALLRGLTARGIVPVFCSSDVVFRGDRGPYAESDRPCPILEYGRQKMAVEDWLARELPRALVVRMTKLFRLDARDGSPVTGILRQLRQGKAVTAATDQMICPVQAGDAARAILRLVRRGERGVFHLAPPPDGWYSRHSLSLTLAEWSGADPALVQPCRLADLPAVESRPADTALLSARWAALGEAPLPTLAQRKPDVLAWLRALTLS